MADTVSREVFHHQVGDDLRRPLFFEQHPYDILAKFLIRQFELATTAPIAQDLSLIGAMG
jgi:hypothetical protein